MTALENTERAKVSGSSKEPLPLTFEYMATKLVEMDQIRDSDLCLIVFAEGTPYSLYQKPDFIAGRIWQHFLSEEVSKTEKADIETDR